MNTIHDNEKNTNRVKRIRSALALQGLSVRQWAINHDEPYTLVHQVVAGTVGKLQSPVTRSGKIQAALKAEGFWPEEDRP